MGAASLLGELASHHKSQKRAFAAETQRGDMASYFVTVLGLINSQAAPKRKYLGVLGSQNLKPIRK